MGKAQKMPQTREVQTTGNPETRARARQQPEHSHGVLVTIKDRLYLLKTGIC